MKKIKRTSRIILILVLASLFVGIIKLTSSKDEYPIEDAQFYHIMNAYKNKNHVVVSLSGPVVLYLDQIRPNANEKKVQRILHMDNIPEMEPGQEYLYVVYKYSFGEFAIDYLVKVVPFKEGGIYLKKIYPNQGPDWITEGDIIWQYSWASWLECQQYRVETLSDGHVKCDD